MTSLAAAAAAKSLQSCPTLCDPTRLPRPWDSPGKNTGVACHFHIQCMKVESESEGAQSYPTLRHPMDCMDPMDGSPPGFSVHGIFQARVLEWVAIAFQQETQSRKTFFFFNLMNYNIKTKSCIEFHKKLVILQLRLPSLLKRIKAIRK